MTVLLLTAHEKVMSIPLPWPPMPSSVSAFVPLVDGLSIWISSNTRQGNQIAAPSELELAFPLLHCW